MAAQRPTRTRVIGQQGELYEGRLSEDQQVALWARCLHDGTEGLVEVVAGRRQADGSLRMRSRSAPERFPPAGDTAALVALARHHRQAGEEVFCTPLTRRVPRSGKAGQILPGHVAWIDIDDPEAMEALRCFRPRPHLVVYSGSGGAHGYWRLAQPIDGDQLEASNRKLAHHLGGDLACTDRARIMRVAGTHNHKANAPCRLAYCNLATRPVPAPTLTAGLPDPEPPPPSSRPAEIRRHRARMAADDAAHIAPPAYFAVLAGVEVSDQGGHIPCPLPDHTEQLASCMVYPDPGGGWWCYGCQRGGTIYDFASLLDGRNWGRMLRGEEFTDIKRRVCDLLGLETPPPKQRRPCRAGAERTRSGAGER